MPRTPDIVSYRETITPGQPSQIPGPVLTMDIPKLPYASDPRVVPGANNVVPASQNLEQILPDSNPGITGINRMSHSSQIRELLLLGLVFIIVVSGIGFGFYSIVKSNQAVTVNGKVTIQSTATATATTSTANAATALARTVTSGTPVLADNLSSNTAGRWEEDATCSFKDGTYHAKAPVAHIPSDGESAYPSLPSCRA